MVPKAWLEFGQNLHRIRKNRRHLSILELMDIALPFFNTDPDDPDKDMDPTAESFRNVLLPKLSQVLCLNLLFFGLKMYC